MRRSFFRWASLRRGLPVYDQPPIPGPGYIWTPGYWAWNEIFQEYYWVPGAWAIAPRPGFVMDSWLLGLERRFICLECRLLGDRPSVFTAGLRGFGYTGVGFAGGYWSGGSFYYNRSMTNISNTTVINNVYNQQVVNNHTTNVSYNGGWRPTGPAYPARTSGRERAAYRAHP